jgi:hypothetical protein
VEDAFGASLQSFARGWSGPGVERQRYEGLIHGFIRMPALMQRANGAIDDVAAAIRSALQGTSVEGQRRRQRAGGPCHCLFQFGADFQQEVLMAVGGHELHADWQARVGVARQ